MALSTILMTITSDKWTLISSAITDVLVDGPANGYSIWGGQSAPAPDAVGIQVTSSDGIIDLSGLASTDQLYARLNAGVAASSIVVMSK